MPTYHGTAKGNVILLPEGVELADGQQVEVRVIPPASPSTARRHAEQTDSEEQFQRHLVARGILTEVKRPEATDPPGDRNPIRVRGKPLSETIIEERR